MAFQTKRIYRALNGGELKQIMLQRLTEAMSLDNTVNIVRGFPLLKYEVRVALTPYRSAGVDRSGAPIDVPDGAVVYEVNGEYFTPVEAAALELVEESPLYGREADPQELRTLAGMGTIETVRTNTGELVDVRTKPGSLEPAVEPPKVTIPDTPPPPPVPPLTQQEVTKALETTGAEDADTTYKIEEQRWAGSHTDPALERAIKSAVDDPQGAMRAAPGRVSIVGGEKGPRHGR
jgi:hypothetical protein